MIKLRHQQPSLWHSGLAEEIADLWEPWMRLVDRLLEDEQLLRTIYEAQGERYPQSRRRGRGANAGRSGVASAARIGDVGDGTRVLTRTTKKIEQKAEV